MEVRVLDNLAASVSIDRDDAAVSQVEHITPIQLQCSAHATSVCVTSNCTSTTHTQVVASVLTQLSEEQKTRCCKQQPCNDDGQTLLAQEWD